MAALEVLALNTTTPQIMAPQSGDTYTFPRAVEMPLGTANGVLYLNGSKVVTSGSGLTFDGTTLGSPQVLLPNGNSYQIKSAAGVASAVLGMDASNNLYLGASGAVATNIFYTGGSEQMRLTNTGLGIGTSSLTARLTIRESASSPNGLDLINRNGTQSWRLSVDAAAVDDKILAFIDPGAGAVRMALDSSGNLGLGVTPSAWGSGFRALQLTYGGVYSQAFTVVGTASNAYNNGTNWLYYSTGQAVSRYEQSQGSHAWYQAVSGTAGNAISFTQAMTLDASGNLLVGTTSSAITVNGLKFLADGSFYTVQNSGVTSSVYNKSNYTSGTDFFADFRLANTTVGSISANGSTTSYNTSSDRRLKENVAPAPSASDDIDAIQIVSHDWKSGFGEHVKYGVIAQDLHAVAPQAVTAGDDGDEIEKTWGVDYSKLVPMLIKEIQSLRARVAAIEA